MELYQWVEYGPCKGFRVGDCNFVNLVLRNLEYLTIEMVIVVAITMVVWAMCRAVRGRIIADDGSVCRQCGYCLTGNVSGTCPECGVRRENRQDVVDERAIQ